MSAAVARTPSRPAGTEIRLAGELVVLDPSGAVHLVSADTLVVADLHLEKGSSLARRGSMLPPYDTGATLASLTDAIAHYRPARVIALGDSFHDPRGPDRLGERDRVALAALVRDRCWTWVVGNHDPALPESLGGRVVDEAALGPFVLRHHPRAGAAAELAGHLHPVAKVVLHGRGVRARAFLSDGERCVLPAFGAYAGGLNACDRAFAPLFPRGFTAHVVGRQRLFSIAGSVLCGD